MKTIASNAPTTIDDLKALGIIGEKKLEEYGARIVKPIKTFVDKEGLESELSRKRPGSSFKKNQSNSPPEQIIEIQDDEEDEFENGIDYSAIDLG